MKTYRNKRTGVEFASDCICKGDDWEEVGADAKKKIYGKKSSGKTVAPVQPGGDVDE